MSLTVAKLHKELGALIEAGMGRRPVLIDKATFYDALEDDGVTLIEVASCAATTITVADGDGWTALNKDGSEKTRKAVVLRGLHGPARAKNRPRHCCTGREII